MKQITKKSSELRKMLEALCFASFFPGVYFIGRFIISFFD
jgi:hypothetical protein